MAVYLVNVYSPSKDLVNELPKIIRHQEVVEEEEYNPDYFGKIYIQVEDGDTIAKELKTNDPIPIFVKADKEDIYFPQPKDISNIMTAVETYKMCLYVLDKDIKQENVVNANLIPEEELSQENYLYYRLLDIKEEKEKNLKNEKQVDQKVKTLTIRNKQ